MELTGKCKTDFEKFLVVGGGKESFEPYYNDNDGIYGIYEWFCKHSLSMKYGVYVDFFDSVKIYVNCFTTHNLKEVGYCSIVRFKITPITRYDYKNLQEARIEAIKKANEIYNLNN